MTWLPIIDESSCIAHGECAETAPEVFRVDDCAVVVGTAPLEGLIAVAECCPTDAISVIDSDSGEQVYP
jgi:ferredoxin